MNIQKLVIGSEKLMSIYGSWPTFHDAEILNIELWRGDLQPKKDIYIFPVLTVKIHLPIEAPTSRETLATLRFTGIENLKLQDFNYQNALLSLEIKEDIHHERSHPEHRILLVKFDGAFGITASFHCDSVEVLDAGPPDPGSPPIAAEPNPIS